MEAVVFDLDATLAVVERDRATLLEEATAAAGGPDLSRQAYRRAHRENHAHETREPIFASLLDDRGGGAGGDGGGPPARAATAGDSADPAALATAYRNAIADALEPVPGVEALLDDLRGTYRVGLLTNGPVRAQREKLSLLGWTDAFDAAVVTGDLDAGKPDERAFRAVLDDLGVAADEAVHVGDDVDADVHGAADAGFAAVQVRYDGGPPPTPRADAVVRRDRLATELPGVLANLDG